MNTLPALPPVVYLAGRYMTSLDMFMAKVRDVLSSTRRNALMEQEHLLALYRDGVLLDWLRTLSPTDHRAGSMAESLEKSMKMQLTDTDAKKYIAKLFGNEIQPVSSLKFSEYVELLTECHVSKDMKIKSESHIISDMIDVQDGEDFVFLTLSFRIIKAANDIIPVTLGEDTFNIDLRTKGKVISGVFQVILSDEGDFTVDLTDGHSVIHTFSFNRGWVDLGFGVKWGTCNVGAKNPWETGDRFVWGAESPDDKIYLKTTFSIFESVFRKPGSKCCMPKMEHFKQLYEGCYIKECTIQNVKCLVFTSKKNGKNIILPLIALWTSTPNSSDTAYYYAPPGSCICNVNIGSKENHLPVRLITLDN